MNKLWVSVKQCVVHEMGSGSNGYEVVGEILKMIENRNFGHNRRSDRHFN